MRTAKAKQNAVNANAPESILGTGLSGSGSSSADQTARNSADADGVEQEQHRPGRNRDPDGRQERVLVGVVAAMAREQNVVRSARPSRTPTRTRRPSRTP